MTCEQTALTKCSLADYFGSQITVMWCTLQLCECAGAAEGMVGRPRRADRDAT